MRWHAAKIRELNSFPISISEFAEIGCGIVPTDPLEREWRQMTGRALSRIAGQSDQVTRVICGIGQRIK